MYLDRSLRYDGSYDVASHRFEKLICLYSLTMFWQLQFAIARAKMPAYQQTFNCAQVRPQTPPSAPGSSTAPRPATAPSHNTITPSSSTAGLPAWGVPRVGLSDNPDEATINFREQTRNIIADYLAQDVAPPQLQDDTMPFSRRRSTAPKSALRKRCYPWTRRTSFSIFLERWRRIMEQSYIGAGSKR